MTVIGEVVIDGLEHGTSIHCQSPRDFIKRSNGVEICKTENELVVDRGGTTWSNMTSQRCSSDASKEIFCLTDKSSVTTLRHHGDSLFVAILHDGTDLFYSLGLDNDLAMTMIFVHPIIVEWGQVIL